MKDTLLQIKQAYTEKQGWEWYSEKEKTSNLNAKINRLNDQLKGTGFTVRNTNNSVSLCKGQCTFTHWHISEYNFYANCNYPPKLSYDKMKEWLEIEKKVTLEVFNNESNTNVGKQRVKELEQTINTLVDDITSDYYEYIIESEYTPVSNNAVWYRNKGYQPNRVTFGNFSKTGKTATITLYFDDGNKIEMKRYSILTFFKSNYYWIQSEIKQQAKLTK
jgi:hypothetical protein